MKLWIALGTMVNASLIGLGFQQGVAPRALWGLTAQQQEILDSMSIVYLDDGFGNMMKTVRFEGVNVQIVNGMGATNSLSADPYETDPLTTMTNGLGNLIVGYQEVREVPNPDDSGAPAKCGGGTYDPNVDIRTGSHNVVVGHQHNYESFGGVVFGRRNWTGGAYAVVTGGFNNRAGGLWSAVSAGQRNSAEGRASSIAGGFSNATCSIQGSILGGTSNRTGPAAGGVGGGNASAILGGLQNRSDGPGATVSGGFRNVSTGPQSSVAGGSDVTIFNAETFWTGVGTLKLE